MRFKNLFHSLAGEFRYGSPRSIASVVGTGLGQNPDDAGPTGRRRNGIPNNDPYRAVLLPGRAGRVGVRPSAFLSIRKAFVVAGTNHSSGSSLPPVVVRYSFLIAIPER